LVIGKHKRLISKTLQNLTDPTILNGMSIHSKRLSSEYWIKHHYAFLSYSSKPAYL